MSGLSRPTILVARSSLPTTIVDSLFDCYDASNSHCNMGRICSFRNKAKELGYASIATAALAAWEWLQREEHLFGAFELKHYRLPERPDSVQVVHPKTGEEAWWPLFDTASRPLFPELMAELDAIKQCAIAGHIFLRDSIAGTLSPSLGLPHAEIWIISGQPSKRLCARQNFAMNCRLVHSVMAVSLREQTPI
jgi:hypothetical protein